MEEFLRQLASGISTGGIYASLALALVIIFRSTGHVNFAQGEMATLSSFLALSFINVGFGYWIAFLLAVVISFVASAIIERVLIRPVRHGRDLYLVTMFIAILMICNGISGWIWGYDVKPYPSPFENVRFLSNTYISPHDIGAMTVTLIVMGLLFVFFQFTRWGLAMRASAENPNSSSLVGISVDRMAALGWGIAAAVGTIAGVMVAPSVYIDPNMMLGVLIYGFAGALLGGINNPWGAVAGGFIVGIVETLLGVYVIGTEIRMSVALVLIVAVLLVKPAGLFGTRAVVRY
jgi:branched-chain amino acid transport system permease protein